jgi:endonuclease YncB( thermonuclease family)
MSFRSFGLSRGVVLPVTIWLAMLAPLPAHAADSASVTDVVDLATLDVALGDSNQRVQLAGIDYSAECISTLAVARLHELVDGQTVSLETDSALSAQDQLGRQFVYVWLPDGRNLGEVLLGEGLARADIGATASVHDDSFAAAQAVAADRHVGAWATDVCPAETPRAGVEAFVKRTAQQAQTASTAVDVPHQQTIIATVSGSAPTLAGWRQATGYAVAELRRAASGLASASPGGVSQPLAQRFALVGDDLLTAADAYSSAADVQDLTRLESSDGQLQASLAALQPLMQELGVLGQRYTFGD